MMEHPLTWRAISARPYCHLLSALQFLQRSLRQLARAPFGALVVVVIPAPAAGDQGLATRSLRSLT